MVCVGPPLLASGPSSGSVPAGRLLLPVAIAPVWLRIRLKLDVTGPRTSGAGVLVLLATIVLAIDRLAPVPTRASPPPPWPAAVALAVLVEIVLFLTGI